MPSSTRAGCGVTRNDVARAAGISPAVVSYVVNGGPRPVRPETRERVLQAIQELGYRPNALARSLKVQQTMALGLIVPDLANPFFAELTRAVEEAGFDRDNTILVGNSMGREDRELDYVRTFLEWRIDGLIIVPVGEAAMVVSELRTVATPLVVVDRYVPGLDAATIVADNFGGGKEATSHLLGHGHDTVACLAGPAGLQSAEERVAGWEEALDEAGVPKEGRLVIRAPFGRAAGLVAARRLLGCSPRPRALFIASDEQAFGGFRAAAELGLRLPEDVAVVGFDGIRQSAFTVPGLTTMRQPVEEVGELAVQTVLGEAGNETVTRLPLSLQRRGSCGCPDVVEDCVTDV